MPPSLPRRACLPAVVLLLAGCAAPPSALARKLDAVLRRPEYAHARWGILIVDADTGKTVHAQNADQFFAPASVTKLFSCAAALAELGADHRFETPAYRRGDLADGKLAGDLILVAGGDLTLGGRTGKDGKMAFADDDHIYASPGGTTTALTDTDPLAGLADLARQVKAAGVQEISGDVLIDDRLFDHSRGSGSGPTLVTPIMVNDNLVDVVVRPAGAPGEPATHTLRPETPFVQVDVRVETVARDKPPAVRTERVGPGRFVVRGQVPCGSAPVVRVCAVGDPAGFARALFIDQLRRAGVVVNASVLRPPTAGLPEKYAGLPRVAVFRSPPLAEALKVTLKVSHNLYASALPQLLAVKHGKRTQADGMRLQGRVLARLGVDLRAVSLQSGAGGGNGDKVSPRAAVGLLQAMRKRRDWPAYQACLPVLGIDGTLAGVVGKDSPARGKVRGKTGTYTDPNLLLGRTHLRSKALAGVMTTARGRALLFALFVNDVPLAEGVQPGREGKALGRLCEILYQETR
jgi:D-alanyl-D-alanine carboxypeptidase/D-alanyl-D-alanine-endopeptidase (penicillin-binding protein 4)